jgi:hypothetical protein
VLYGKYSKNGDDRRREGEGSLHGGEERMAFLKRLGFIGKTRVLPTRKET